MKSDRDEIPTLVITDSDGYLVRVGSPEVVTKEELSEYVRNGYGINTMPYKDFVAKNLIWIYDKP